MTSHRRNRRPVLRRWLPTCLVVAAAIAVVVVLTQFHGARPRLAPPPTTVSPAARLHTAAAQPPQTPPPASPVTHTHKALPNPCRGNHDAQRVIVSIAKQHAWMCAGLEQVRDSAVTTGATADGNGTPTGTWHVQAKQVDRWLTVLGGDSYHVEYWMPYDGSYGFHDSHWQTFAYGSPHYRTGGSHGCVHLPLPLMKWLYHWAHVGATVTIRS